MKKILLFFTIFSTSIYATELISDNSKTLFSINDINYTKNIFPKKFETFSLELQKRFASKYVFYKLLLDSLEHEELEYKEKIEKNIKREENKQKRIGEILSPFKKMFFKQKIIVDTIAYNELLKENHNIDKEAYAFYQKNKKGFFYPKRVELSVIILDNKELADKIIKQIDKNNIQLFSKFAKKYSIDQVNAKRGGYIGLIVKKNTNNFQVYYNAKENAIIPKVLESNGKYIIAYILKKYSAEQKNFNVIKDDIKKYLLKKEIENWKSIRFKRLKKKVTLKLNF